MAVDESSLSPLPTRSIFGLFSVPTRIYPWVLMLLIQIMMPGVSLIGHLAGILVGTIHSLGGFNWLIPSFVTLRKVCTCMICYKTCWGCYLWLRVCFTYMQREPNFADRRKSLDAMLSETFFLSFSSSTRGSSFFHVSYIRCCSIIRCACNTALG
jgi:hypothetical protein